LASVGPVKVGMIKIANSFSYGFPLLLLFSKNTPHTFTSFQSNKQLSTWSIFKKEKSGNDQTDEKGCVHGVHCAGVTRNFAYLS
jgi:hypothetical protein